MEEVRGRTLLDEGGCVDLPVVVQQNLICVPGIDNTLTHTIMLHMIHALQENMLS